MIVNIGLPGWFVAIGLGVMVEQPDPREILCFVVAIFSLTTKFDVCPVGWYNRQMEFLGRTTFRKICGDISMIYTGGCNDERLDTSRGIDMSDHHSREENRP